MKKWLLATRPWSFTASVIPLTLGAALAWASDAAHAGLFLLTLLGGVAVQTGTNMLNIYGDYRSGVDTEASAHGESPILLGLISPEAMRRGGLIALCVAFAVGIVLGFACGWPILAFGLVGDCGRLRLHQRLLALQIPCLRPDYGVPAHGAAHGASRLLHSGGLP